MKSRIEFALDEPGTYHSIDASSWAADCATSIRSGDSPDMSNFWIFPTLDANVVFVQWERQLVLLEMRGERIARMLNFATAPSKAT